jgi:hypothetical protein
MKNAFFILFSIILIFNFSTLAQIPNASFEKWQENFFTYDPVGWSTNNSPHYTTISRSYESHSGFFAIKGTIGWQHSIPFAPYISTAFTINFRPKVLKGYYEFFPVDGDTLYITSSLFSKGNQIATASLNISNVDTTSYKLFGLEYNYSTLDIPDSCMIEIFIEMPYSPSYSNNTYFLMDDLELSEEPLSVESLKTKNEHFELSQNYPNPFNPTTEINFEIPKSEFVSLKIYNILGKEVAVLVNEEKRSGSYNIRFNGNELSGGVYFYRLQAGKNISTKKMIILK